MAANSRYAVALHLLVALALLDASATTSEDLARSVATNPVVVRRVLAALVKAGLVEGRAGKSGGYSLGRRADKIHLADVYRAIEPEGPFAIHANPANKACAVSCSIKGLLGETFAGAGKALEQHLKRTTIADLARRVPADT